MDDHLEDLQARLQRAFVPERAAGVDARVQLNLSGDKSGDWYVVIKDQKIDLQSGSVANPNLTIAANYQDVLEMYQGRLDPMRAFMGGKIRLSGDTALAMRLLGMFRMP